MPVLRHHPFGHQLRRLSADNMRCAGGHVLPACRKLLLLHAPPSTLLAGLPAAHLGAGNIGKGYRYFFVAFYTGFITRQRFVTPL